MKKNELFFDGVFWSIVEKWNKSSKKDKRKTVLFLGLVSLFPLFSLYILLFFIEIAGIISFFKLKNGDNQLHAWISFSLFLVINSLIIVILIVLAFGALMAPFTN